MARQLQFRPHSRASGTPLHSQGTRIASWVTPSAVLPGSCLKRRIADDLHRGKSYRFGAGTRYRPRDNLKSTAILRSLFAILIVIVEVVLIVGPDRPRLVSSASSSSGWPNSSSSSTSNSSGASVSSSRLPHRDFIFVSVLVVPIVVVIDRAGRGFPRRGGRRPADPRDLFRQRDLTVYGSSAYRTVWRDCLPLQSRKIAS